MADRQFLIGRRNIPAQYDSALAHAREQAVATHHGNVGEAAVRDWLTTFLPKRFAVTPGYVQRQGFEDKLVSSHFDVLIYDQIEAPTLWLETHTDKAEGGRSRIIPAENVYGVVEVKAALNRRSADEAAKKLSELTPFLATVDASDAPFPQFLPSSAVCAMLFIEQRQSDGHDLAALAAVRGLRLPRGFRGGLVLRGEGRSADVTGSILRFPSAEGPIRVVVGSMAGSFVMTETAEIDGHHAGVDDVE